MSKNKKPDAAPAPEVPPEDRGHTNFDPDLGRIDPPGEEPEAPPRDPRHRKPPRRKVRASELARETAAARQRRADKKRG